MGPFLYFLVVECSMFALGAATVAITLLARRRPPQWWAYALTTVCIGGLVGIILRLVLPARTVNLTTYSVAYIALLIGLSIGLVFVSIDIIRRTAPPKEAL